MAIQQKEEEIEFPLVDDPPMLCLSTSRVMELDLLTLPQFNVTYIARCLTVPERLSLLPCIHSRFRNFILQPQCFPDMSFFPVHDDQMYDPKIISSNGNFGITYVEINIFSKHAFIQRVALLAGMWNFKCDLWNQIDWPSNVNIESLQLTLDYSSQCDVVHLDIPPKLQMDSLPSTAHISPIKADQRDHDDDTTDNLDIDIAECISPTTRKVMEFQCRLRNLFFIRFDSSGHQPMIQFPKTLWGLGLQSFTSLIFAQSWWKNQIQIDHRFESLRFLVLSCCEFMDDELQILLANTINIEHLSMRYVRWDGMIEFPSTLLSLGYFPDRHFEGFYSFKNSNKIWQISTRLNENDDASIKFLNETQKIKSIKRVKFEYIRHEGYNETDFDFSKCNKWISHKDEDDLQVVINKEDLDHYPILYEIFETAKENFIDFSKMDFADCPYWSDASKDFIHMTRKRKLLLR